MKAPAWGLAGDEGSFLCYSFCCRLRRLLHGALYLPSGDTAQLAVPQAGGRLPQQGVWEQQRSSRQNHEGWESASPLPLMHGSIWKWSQNTYLLCVCSLVQPVWLSESIVSLQSSASSVLFWLWDVPAPTKSESVAWVWNRTSYLYMNTTVRLKEVVRLTSNQIISTSACVHLIGCWDFIFQRAVSPPVPCPAPAPPPLSPRAPPLTSPLTTKRKSARNPGLGNVGRMCLSSTHARTHTRTWAADLCVLKCSWILWPLREFAVAAG